GVFLSDGGGRVGELDEEMVYEAREGQTFVLGASTWRIEEITRDRVLVSPAPGLPGIAPFWKGEGVGRPAELGEKIGNATAERAGPARDRPVLEGRGRGEAGGARREDRQGHARARRARRRQRHPADRGRLPPRPARRPQPRGLSPRPGGGARSTP